MEQDQLKIVKVEYFAVLKQESGCSFETCSTAASTADEFYNELKKRHQFTLAAKQMKVAINEEFQSWDTKIKHGDVIVFIPPVAGG